MFLARLFEISYLQHARSRKSYRRSYKNLDYIFDKIILQDLVLNSGKVYAKNSLFNFIKFRTKMITFFLQVETVILK